MTQFTAVLNSETNETMIVHLVTELSKWVKLSPSSIPAELVERLKVGDSKKYLRCYVCVACSEYGLMQDRKKTHSEQPAGGRSSVD